MNRVYKSKLCRCKKTALVVSLLNWPLGHRRPKIGLPFIKTSYESLTQFRKLLENGPK